MTVYLPAALVVFRALVSPLLVWGAWDGMVTGWFLAVFSAAFLSDVLDGMIARRLGVSTSRLRYADTWADITLYLAVLLSAWLTHKATLMTLGWPFALLLASTAASWGMDLLRYGRLSRRAEHLSRAGAARCDRALTLSLRREGEGQGSMA